jgi:hypothetical protein
VCTLCAKIIPKRPISTVPESVEVIKPNPIPSCNKNFRECPKLPSKPAISNTFLGVLNKLANPIATKNAKKNPLKSEEIVPF